MTKSPRVLVLGSERHGRGVRAYSWRAIPEHLNVADFEVVVLNFGEFADDSVRTNVSLSTLPSVESFARLIFSEESIIIAIGVPGLEFGSTEPVLGGASRWSFRTTTWWLPVDLPVTQAHGEAIESVSPTWDFWFQNVKMFEWHFWNKPQPADMWTVKAARAAVPSADAFTAQWDPLASTRYGDPLGIRLNVIALQQLSAGSRFSDPDIRTQEAPAAIYWIPSSTELGQHEAITELLRAVAGVAVETPPPEWVTNFLLPSQVSAAENVKERKLQVEAASTALAVAEDEAAQESRFSRLLYEQGKEALEPVAREALGILGADVTEPEFEGIEDGRLVDPQGRPAMLEIKGRRGQLKLEDVRQLDGWMRTAIAEEGWSGKGIVVANLKLEAPPDERHDLVPPNALAFAERIGVAILTTGQLHEALRRKQESQFDGAAFWNAVFGTDGLVELSEPRQNVQ